VTLLDEVRRAYEEIKAEPERMQIWAPILAQIAPTLLTQAQQAIDLSHDIAVKALTEGMFKGNRKAKEKALAIAKALTNVETHKEHGRHIHAEDCKKLGLKIVDLESDNDLQDAVLSVHHAFVITLSNTQAVKIIENHAGSAFVKQASAQAGAKLMIG
jgi:hypothetical protein